MAERGLSRNVFSLPGPFRAQRIVELQGSFLEAETLFPGAPLDEIRSTAASRDPRLYDRGRNLLVMLVMSFHSIVVRTLGCTILVDSCVGNDLAGMNRCAVLLLAPGLLAGCAPAEAPVETTPPANAAAAEAPAPTASGAAGNATAHTVAAPDGVTIHYDDMGAGEPALVFVHGWSCDRSYWSGQTEHFARSHRVVNVDLAGHGDSGPRRSEWTMQAFGEDVASIVTALDLRNVVLVGHSMGGKVVVEAAGQLGDRVIGVVGVDTFHGGGRETPRERQEEVFEQLAENYAGFIANFVDRTFVERSDPAIREWVQADMAAAPYASAVGARRASGRYDATPVIAALDVPLILINSDFLPTDTEHLEASAKHFEYRELSGVGHFLMLEDPETFNALLAAVLADIT